VSYRATHPLEASLILTELRFLETDDRARLEEIQARGTTTLAGIIADGSDAGHFTTRFPDDSLRAVLAMCNAVARWYDPAKELALDELMVRCQILAHALRTTRARRVTKRAS
jgi:hypothetical protein